MATITRLEQRPPEQLAGKQEQRLRFIELRAQGWSLARIAGELKLSKTTLSNWSQELEAEIAGLKAIELESLQEQYFLLKEGRLRLLGELVEKLRQEALSRDLSTVATEKLLDLLLRYHAELKAEYVEVRPLSEEQIAGLKSRDKSGPKLDSETVARGLAETLQRYKTGLIDIDRAREELALYTAMLRAEDQAILEEKLERIEAVLETRETSRRSK